VEAIHIHITARVNDQQSSRTTTAPNNNIYQCHTLISTVGMPLCQFDFQLLIAKRSFKDRPTAEGYRLIKPSVTGPLSDVFCSEIESKNVRYRAPLPVARQTRY
jgi:hypothetical protein